MTEPRRRRILDRKFHMPDHTSCFLFSLPKAGSVLLNSLVRDLAAEVGLDYRSLMDEFFIAGVADDEIPDDIGSTLPADGCVFGGFRSWPERLKVPILGDCRKVFLIRDPRDMLVSQYFSVRHSHPLPGGNGRLHEEFVRGRQQALAMTIDDFVLDNCQEVIRHLQGYRPILDDPLTRIYRYEDVIFSKAEWAYDMAQFFGWPLSAERCAEIASRHDRKVTGENPLSHVRRVAPGDHLEKLRADTVARVDFRLRCVLAAFGYRGSSYCPEALDHRAIPVVADLSKSIVGMRMEAVTTAVPPTDCLPLRVAAEGQLIDDGSVVCEGYWLEDGAGQVVNCVTRDAPFRVRYVITARCDLPEALLGVSLIHARSGLQAGRNSADIGAVPLVAGQRLLVTWDVARLAQAGEYFGSVGISSFRDPMQFHLRQYRARPFFVTV